MIETAAELRSHYADVRRRLTRPAKPVPKTVVEPNPTPVREFSAFRPFDETKFKTFNAGQPITGCLGTEQWSLDGSTVPTMQNIAKAVCCRYGVSIIEIKSHRRFKAMVKPRFVAMYICKILTKFSYQAIGKHFGNRDHTTCIHAVQWIEAEIVENTVLRNEIADICKQFASNSYVSLAMRAAMGRLG